MFGSRRVASGRDVEQARQALSDVFLPVEFPSARPTTVIDLQLNALTVGRVTCGYMRFQDAVRIETAEAENYHIDIPTGGRAKMRAALSSPVHGTPQTGGVFMPGRPVELDCGEQFSQLALMIPRHQLVLELENLLDAEVAQPLEFSSELSLTTTGGQTVMQTLRMIDAASKQQDGPLEHPLAAQRLEQVLMTSLLFAHSHNYTAALAGTSPAAGKRPIAMAAELLRTSPAHPWTVAELAAEVSVSVRSLQEGFRRSLDTTPLAYLRHLRLEKVHDELTAAEPGTASVTEVATRWGFVHLGRFAAAYRGAFGERPSETTRSATSRQDG